MTVSGVSSGGPYYCAQGNLWYAYLNCTTPGAWTQMPPLGVLKVQTGSSDRSVKPEVVRALQEYYSLYQANTVLVAHLPAGHAMVTENAGNPCPATEPPYINRCGYDAAGELLKHLLGMLQPPAEKEIGRLIRFDQKAHAGGERFVREAGYNRWAGSNRLVVLYPQTVVRYFPVFNPRGCWDWWGYSGANYWNQTGAQIRAVKAMIERLAAPR